MQRFARDTSDPAKRRGTMNTTESLCDLEPERSEVRPECDYSNLVRNGPTDVEYVGRFFQKNKNISFKERISRVLNRSGQSGGGDKKRAAKRGKEAEDEQLSVHGQTRSSGMTHRSDPAMIFGPILCFPKHVSLCSSDTS